MLGHHLEHMKVLLRNTRTGMFYAGPDQWADDPTQALDFEMTDRALDAVRDAGLNSMEVLMRFEDPIFEIPLSVVGNVE